VPQTAMAYSVRLVALATFVIAWVVGGGATPAAAGEAPAKAADVKPAATAAADGNAAKSSSTKPAESAKAVETSTKPADASAKPAAKKAAEPAAKPAAPAKAAEPLAEFLLPTTTKGFLSITNVTVLNAQWDKTQLGQLMADPVMQPFAKDLRRQLESRLSRLEDRLGLTLDDLREVPSGELAVAIVQPKPADSALVTIMDVAGRQKEAQAMIKKSTERLMQRGSKQSRVDVHGVQVVIFDVPPAADDRDGQSHQTGYFLRGDLFAAADDVDVVRGVAEHLASGKRDGTLGALKGFQQVMARCHKDAGDVVPNARWWIEPIGYAEAVRAAQREENRRKGKTIFQLLRNQGFQALQGVGGFVNFKIDSYEILHRTAAYAPPPYEKSMKMLVLPNVGQFTPQQWVPRDIASYSTFYIDVMNAFDNFGPLYEELFAEGEKGAWEEVLKALEVDPNGPRINLRKELIANLNNRVSVVSDYQLPITVHSERLLYAIEAKDQGALTKAIAKWMSNDPTMKRREWKGHIIWEAVEEEIAVPSISIDAIPSVNPNESHVRRPARAAAAQQDQERVLPHAAVTVAHGQLFIASHIDILQKVLVLPKDRERLERDIDFKLVQRTLDALKFAQSCMRGFSRTDEEYRPNYELLRQGKMPESETMFARALNGLFGVKKGTSRKQRLDGSQLPNYQVVRRYLGPAGITAVSEADGWFVKGFTLPKLNQ